jgi:hypothetical protein
VINWLNAAEKTPIDAIILMTVNSTKPIEANAIFTSFVLTRERSDTIVSNVDRPRKENLRKISISFIGQTFLMSKSFL